MNYEWKCPDCKKATSGSTTGNYRIGDKIECCWCGRVSKIVDITCVFDVKEILEKITPTKLEELKALSKSEAQK